MQTQDREWLLKEKYDGVETPEFLADCERIDAGEPLAYVIGYIPFLDSTIYLDSKPLIPRPETEFWVEKAIAEIQKGAATESPRVLDLCAGSGAIGIAVAKAIPDAHVTFAEIDPTHLPTIKKNLTLNNIAEMRYDLVESDLFANVSGQFEFILSNPPYIDPALDRAETSVKDFEPHLALYGGEGGMELIERIVVGARASLAPQGSQLWLEHEPEQTETIHTLATEHGFTATTYPDQYDTDRYSVLRPTVAQ